MSRSYLKNEKGRWRMFCDVCYDHDARTYDNPPDLDIFRSEGWSIGSRVDACPVCVSKAKLPEDQS
jgi:hypothetical protein